MNKVIQRNKRQTPRPVSVTVSPAWIQATGPLVFTKIRTKIIIIIKAALIFPCEQASPIVICVAAMARFPQIKRVFRPMILTV